MTALYNEIDPYAAQWLRNLIAAGHIAPGDVTEKDIRDVRPSDLEGYTQVHFFAGIGVWSHALRLAGWPDDRPVWTGSCPCQPFSAAGRRGGVADERHLWPHWFHLIGQCQPASVFGEQVASKDGLGWLDIVQADMEGAGYAFGAADLCVAGFGGPHIRQRLFFGASRVEHASDDGSQGRAYQGRQAIDGPAGCDGAISGVADPDQQQFDRARCIGTGRRDEPSNCGAVERMEHAGSERRERRETTAPRHQHDGETSVRSKSQYGSGQSSAYRVSQDAAYPTDGFWRDADWLGCRDGKFRPVRPGSFPLVNGAAPRMGCMCACCGMETRRQGVDVLTLREGLLGHERRIAEEILRQGVLSVVPPYAATDEQKYGALSGAGGNASDDVFDVRHEEKPSRTSHRSQRAERRGGKFAGSVRGMPPSGACDATPNVELRGMRYGIYGEVTQEPEQDLFCPLCQRVGAHFCEEEMAGDRAGRLRAYGNAISPWPAKAFIESFDDACRGHFQLDAEEDIFS